MKNVMAVFFAICLTLTLGCGGKKNNPDGEAKLEEYVNCCDEIMSLPSLSVDTMVSITIRRGSHSYYFSVFEIYYSVTNGKRLLISRYEIVFDSTRDGFYPFMDTIKNVNIVTQFKERFFSQSLLKQPCGINYTNDSILAIRPRVFIYINKKGKEECYACVESEVKSHPEFKYFFDIFNDSKYFKITYSDFKNRKMEILDSLKQVINSEKASKL
jgi:hypothetical protein